MDYYIWGDVDLTAAEFEYILAFESLDRWHNTRVLYNEKGELLTEMFVAMISISSYKFAAQQKASGQQEWFDIGSGA